tara:strand:+ start:534 stop:965 length:432 start_codon:yes stop_codon:yes gene_type:complete
MGDLKLNAASGSVTLTPATGSDVTLTVPNVTSSLAALAEDQAWTGSQRATLSVVTDGTLDMDSAQNFKYTPGAADTLEFSNETDGQSGFIILINPSAYTISLGSEVKSPGGTGATDLSAAGTYIVSYLTDGTTVYVTYGSAQS